MIRVDVKHGNAIFCDNMYIHNGILYCFKGKEKAGETNISNIDVIYEEKV